VFACLCEKVHVRVCLRVWVCSHSDVYVCQALHFACVRMCISARMCECGCVCLCAEHECLGVHISVYLHIFVDVDMAGCECLGGCMSLNSCFLGMRVFSCPLWASACFVCACVCVRGWCVSVGGCMWKGMCVSKWGYFRMSRGAFPR